MTVPPRPDVLARQPYVPGESRLPGFEKPIKLASNESALGASPAVAAALAEAGARLHLYPDGLFKDLREALASRYGIDAARIVFGVGSSEIIGQLARAYVGPGDDVVQGEYAFMMFRLEAKTAGARVIAVPEPDYRVSVDALLAAVTLATRLVYLPNPNNPTGTVLPIGEVRRLRNALRADILLVLDAAYGEYVTAADYEDGFSLVDEAGENTIVLKTFSKIYGLAGLRLGWAYAPPAVLDVLYRIRGPFNVTTASAIAGLAALRDQAHVEKARAHNARWRAWLEAELAALGFHIVPGVCNFTLVTFEEPGAFAKLDAFLRSRGIIVRVMTGFGLANALRITVGTEAENRALVAALEEYARDRAA
jgi:histidinol-phosphate aminotransferase